MPHRTAKKYITAETYDTIQKKEGQPLTAPLRYGGGSGNINSCTFNKQPAFRQVSGSNPPQRKAAARYSKKS